MIYGGSQLVLKTMASGQVTPALQLPMGLVYGAIPFAGAIILFYSAIFAFELWRDGPSTPEQGETVPLGGPLD